MLEVHDTDVKMYGWRSGRLVQIVLTTSSDTVKLGLTVSKKYSRDDILACFKTSFLANAFPKLVIVMRDGNYVIIKDSVAEISTDAESRNYYVESNKGGTAFEEIYRHFTQTAAFKNLKNPPSACLKGTPTFTLILLAIISMTPMLFGFQPAIVTLMVILAVFLIYELHCVASLTRFVQKLQNEASTKP